MKQTAVEFLIDTWVKTGTLKAEDMFQATQMEKEQIIEANENKMPFISGNDYYNETFKSE